MANTVIGVEEKQLVTHLWMRLQKESSLSSIFMRGVKRSEPYRRIGAMREVASLVAELRGEAFAGRGEALYRVEGALGKREPAGKMGIGGQGRCEPIAQPSDFVLGGEVQVVKPNARGGGGGAFLGGAPVNELSLGDREGQAFWGRYAAEGAVMTLKKLDVPSMGGGGNCDHEVINVGED